MKSHCLQGPRTGRTQNTRKIYDFIFHELVSDGSSQIGNWSYRLHYVPPVLVQQLFFRHWVVVLAQTQPIGLALVEGQAQATASFFVR